MSENMMGCLFVLTWILVTVPLGLGIYLCGTGIRNRSPITVLCGLAAIAITTVAYVVALLKICG